MKTLWTLIKTGLNVNFGISALKYRFTKEKKRLWEPLVIFIAIIFGGGSLVFLWSSLLIGVFMGGAAYNQPEMVLTLAFMVSQVVVLFFGLFYMISAFYFSKDLNILIPLPLKASQIIGSKFAIIMANEYLTLLPLTLPALIIYGTGTGQGILFWLKGITLVLAAPVIPLIIDALFVMGLMRFVNLRKSKDLLVVIGSFVGLLFGIGINFFTQRMPAGNEQEYIENLIKNQSGLLESIGQKFPPSLWATYGLTRPGWEGLGYFTLFVALSALLFVVLLWLSNRIFYKSLLSGQEVHRRKKVLSADEMVNSTNYVSSPVLALLKREWKIFIRTPIYAMNGLAGIMMMPVLLFMPVFTQDGRLEALIQLTRQPQILPIVTLGISGMMLFVANVGIVSSTSISREGNTIWISQVIPVAPKQQMIAKLLHGISISLFGIVVIGIAFAFVLKVSVTTILLAGFLAILGSLLLNILNLMIDVIRPKLEWTNPQEAVKQNFNAFLGFLINFLSIFVFGAVAALLILLQLPQWSIFLILTVIIAMLITLAYWGLIKIANWKYRRIEI